MKLSYKVCSPFLLPLMAAILFSCQSDDKDNKRKTAVIPAENRQAQAYLDQAEKYDGLKQYDKAFASYNKAKESYISHADSLMAGYALTKMAGIQNLFGDYYGSENTTVEALKFLKVDKQGNYLSAAYNILGISYKKLLNFDQSIIYYNKASKLTDDPYFICILRNNIASIHTETGHYETALPILLELLKAKAVNDHPETKAMILNNLGALYFKTGKTGALQYLRESLAIRKELHDMNGMTSSYLNLSEFYQWQNKILSKTYALKANETAAKTKNPEDRLRALQMLRTSADGAEFKRYATSYITLSDSVGKMALNAKSQFAAIKYDAKNAEAETLRLRALQNINRLKAQQDKVEKIILGLAVALVVITGGFIIYILILKHKKEKSLQVYNTETRMSKKIHDELANDMFKVMSFAESQDFSSPAQLQKLVQNLDLLYNKTRDISRENNTIDTSENYGRFLIEMLADYKTAETNVMTVNFEAADWAKMETHKKITVYRVLQELMVNMKKHSRATIVAFKFIKDEKKITIQYTDNGQGFSSEKLIRKNGLQNAETRMLALNGSFTFESKPGKGLKVIMAIPL